MDSINKNRDDCILFLKEFVEQLHILQTADGSAVAATRIRIKAHAHMAIGIILTMLKDAGVEL